MHTQMTLPFFTSALTRQQILSANDLFAGSGGWDEGIKMLGEATGRPSLHEGVVGFEFEANACATARAAGHNRIEGDLSLVNPADHPALGLIASPPCQGFSPAGKGRGRDDFERLLIAIDDVMYEEKTIEQAIEWLKTRIADDKSALILEPLRWILRMPERPRWVALEQVKTCLPIWEAYGKFLRHLGYSVWTGLVHSEEYGVPQTRTRAVLLASLDKDVSAGPTPTHLKYHTTRHKGAEGRARHIAEAKAAGLLPAVTMAEGINMGLKRRPSYTVQAGGTRGSHSGGEWGSAAVRNSLHEAIAEGEDAWKPRAANEGTTEADMDWANTRPSVTMVSSYRPDVAAAPKYRKPGDGPRQKAHGSITVTPQEAGILQSFPADYPWHGTEGKQYQQSGNAVPPVMAAALIDTVTTTPEA